MTFNTSTTIKEQVDYVKKYGLIIQFKKLTVFQCVALIALLINFICCLLYHFYFFCAYDIFLFIGLMFYLTIRIRKNIKIPDSISSGSTLNLCTTIKIEITGKEIICTEFYSEGERDSSYLETAKSQLEVMNKSDLVVKSEFNYFLEESAVNE